jgi:RNA polymerase primary sigma factor
MKLTFNIRKDERPIAGRLARISLAKKSPHRVRCVPKDLPPPAEENVAAEAVPEIKVAPIEAGISLRKDSLQLYLNEIGRVNLLTPEEEFELAKRVQCGDKTAREKMITANLRLVVKLARNYEGLGLPLLDLINEGNIGLMKGVERFDPNKGSKLSYYAMWWIKQSMMRALSYQSKTIRLPVHVVEKMAYIRRAEVKLREDFGHEPTDKEIAEHLGLPTHRIQQYRTASKTPISLDAPICHDEPDPISEAIADANAAAPFDRLIKENNRGLIREALATLNARESRILSMRFGLDNGSPKTLEEIAVRFDVTRERIRQIQEGALKKMRSKIEASESPVTRMRKSCNPGFKHFLRNHPKRVKC